MPSFIYAIEVSEDEYQEEELSAEDLRPYAISAVCDLMDKHALIVIDTGAECNIYAHDHDSAEAVCNYLANLQLYAEPCPYESTYTLADGQGRAFHIQPLLFPLD